MAKKAAPRGRGASARPSARASNRQQRQVPVWVWVFTGILAGGFFMFLYHLATLRSSAADMAGVKTKPAETAQADTQSSGPRFDFYAVLPKMEVIIPKGEDEQRPSRRSPDTPPADSSKPASNAGTAVVDRHEQYQLQAGSFRRNADADRRRGELILHGLNARVQPVSMGNGDTWYRVMVGPFDSANAAHRTQDKLASAGIETLAIRSKSD